MRLIVYGMRWGFGNVFVVERACVFMKGMGYGVGCWCCFEIGEEGLMVRADGEGW